MPECHPLADCQQTAPASRPPQLRRGDDEPLARAPQQHRVAQRLRCGDQQQTSDFSRQWRQSPNEAFLDPPVSASRSASQTRRPTVGRQSSWQLEQGQWIAAHLGDDLVPHSLIHLERHRRARAARGHRRSPRRDLQVRHLCSAGPAPARRTRSRPARPTGDGRRTQRQRRGLIQPLRIVHDAQQRTLLSGRREQAQHAQPEQKPIRRSPALKPNTTSIACRCGAGIISESLEQRTAQLMQAGVGHLHLQLHPSRPHDRQIRCRLDQVFEQRRFPDPGLALQHQ